MEEVETKVMDSYQGFHDGWHHWHFLWFEAPGGHPIHIYALLVLHRFFGIKIPWKKTSWFDSPVAKLLRGEGSPDDKIDEDDHEWGKDDETLLTQNLIKNGVSIITEQDEYPYAFYKVRARWEDKAGMDGLPVHLL